MCKSYGSVNPKCAHTLSPHPARHLSDICHFALEKLEMFHGGPKSRVQMPYRGTTPKLHFPVKKLQIPYLWETYNNLIKLAHEAPYTNRF